MPDKNYFCVENVANEGNTIKFQSSGTFTFPILEYSIDNGSTWTNYTIDSDISLSIGDKCYFRGDNFTFNTGYSGYIHITSTADIALSGNIMSLLDKTCESLIIYSPYCFYSLCSTQKLVSIDNLLLPAMTLANNCYASLFSNSKITTVPNNLLPAITLKEGCYSSLFSYCTLLTNMPDVNFTKVAKSCCSNMFYYCRALTLAKKLPFPSAESCYNQMFYYCSSLATFNGLEDDPNKYEYSYTGQSCCYDMFYGCTSLTTVLGSMPSATGTSSFRGMFSGCTSLINAPALPAKYVRESSYASMFYGCTSLTIPPELPSTSLGNSCYNSMFQRCTSLQKAPALPATTLADSCYGSMFLSCTSLQKAPALPATKLAPGCYASMFYYCSNLVSPCQLPAKILADYCYREMFYGCSAIQISTSQTGTCQYEYRLPADGHIQKEANYAWTGMFGNSITISISDYATYYINNESYPNRINFEIENLKYECSNEYITDDLTTVTIKLMPAVGFILPDSVVVTGADYLYNSSSGIISLSNLSSNITVVASGKAEIPVPEIVDLANDILVIKKVQDITEYEVQFNEVV